MIRQGSISSKKPASARMQTLRRELIGGREGGRLSGQTRLLYSDESGRVQVEGAESRSKKEPPGCCTRPPGPLLHNSGLCFQPSKFLAIEID